MLLEHPELEPFEPLVSKLARIAHRSGIEALESVGLRLVDIKENEKARRRFIRGCHYGFDLAQRQIAAQVIAIENHIRNLEQGLSKLRQARDPRTKDFVALIRVLRMRQTILRRIVDSILWTIVAAQQWVLRRMTLEDEIRRIDPPVLERTLRFAVDRNRRDRLSFSVVVDLTTVAHIGDLIEVAWTPKASTLTVVELKEGKINQILCHVLEEKDKKLSEEDLHEIRRTLGKHAPRQAQRLMAQLARLDQFKEIMETDKGFDSKLGMEIRLNPEPIEVDDYDRAISKICANAREKGVDCTVIDRCLRLVAVSKKLMPTHDSGAIQHLLYHLASPHTPCLLENPRERETELKSVFSVPPFINLIHHNLLTHWGRPVYIWEIEPETTIDLVTGRIRLYAQFDMEAFFKLAEEDGLKMSWIRGKDADEIKNLSFRIPGSPDAWGVRVELPDGSVQRLLSGFVSRAIMYLTRPRDLLKMIKLTPRDEDFEKRAS